MTAPSVLTDLTDAGVSIWLDDLDRHRLESGNLADLIGSRCVRGVTTNPTIFGRAITSEASAYAHQISSLAAAGADADGAVRAMTTDDVRAACDVFMPLWESSGGVDGRVSIEVDPRLARKTHETIVQARELFAEVNRPNVLIKIPACSRASATCDSLMPKLSRVAQVACDACAVPVTVSPSNTPWSATASRVFSGIVFTHPGATRPSTYMVSGNAGSFTPVDAHRGR
jgi:transaldolase